MSKKIVVAVGRHYEFTEEEIDEFIELKYGVDAVLSERERQLAILKLAQITFDSEYEMLDGSTDNFSYQIKR